MSNVEEFLKEYNELAEKHGMYIGPKLKYHRIASLEVVVEKIQPMQRIDISPILEKGKWIMGVSKL